MWENVGLLKWFITTGKQLQKHASCTGTEPAPTSSTITLTVRCSVSLETFLES